jgi:hypothetical protein
VSRKHRDLDIDEDLAFQEKEWFVQRIGMALLFLFVLGAALGLTGMGGPLSTARAGRPEEPVFVEYERFVRHGATSTVRLHLRGNPGVVKFWVSAPYAASVRVSSVEPPAQKVVVENDRQVYAIEAATTDLTVTFVMEPLRFGTMNGELGLVGGPSVQLSQFVLF